MKLKGKKIACFLALPHHTRFFIPLRDEIRKHGGELLFVTILSEFPYELDLTKKKLPFRFFSDYADNDVRQKVRTSANSLLDEWADMCFKWDGFKRWPLYKQCWFFGDVVEEYHCIERFIEVEKPDMFIAHHECNRWGQTIGHLCHKKNVPFVTFQEGDYHGDYIGLLMHTHYSTACLLWGEKTRQVLARYKCSSGKMTLIGNTHIENAVKMYSSPGNSSTTLQELGIEAGKKIIVFLLDIKYGGITKKEIWKECLQGLEKIDKDAVCIFKWHPSVLRASFEQIREAFKELFPSAVLLDAYDPYKLLAISDYCVTMGKTTLAIEALAFGKPLFSFPSIDTMEDIYVQMGVAQTVFPAGNWQNLLDTMANGLPASIQDNVAKWLQEYFYKLDGKTLQRAVDRMSFVLKVHRDGAGGRNISHREFTKGRLSFVIPSGDDAEALMATLTSLSQNVKHGDWEVVIILDNDSIRGVLSALSGDVKIVQAGGSSLAVLYNKGAEKASGEFIVFMRPGIVYFKDGDLLDKIRDGNVAGLAIRNKDMSPYCLGIGFDFNSTPYRLTADTGVREAVGGGFIAMKRETFETVGGFDEDLANHLIEPDVCLKARESKLPISYVPEALAFNYIETFFGRDISDDNWRNRVKFFAKWVGKLPHDEDFLTFAGDLLKV